MPGYLSCSRPGRGCMAGWASAGRQVCSSSRHTIQHPSKTAPAVLNPAWAPVQPVNNQFKLTSAWSRLRLESCRKMGRQRGSFSRSTVCLPYCP